MTGRVFDIKRYSIHDGPGIRTTVFMKGCPLRCLWCHNPEGIAAGPELMHWPGRCARCYSCVETCPAGAIARHADGPAIDKAECDLCGKCAEACVYEAMQVVGRGLRTADLLAEIERDRIFFEQSGGGVTFSGGEPLAQPEFLAEVLDELEARGVSTAIDTSGFAPAEVVERIAAKTSLVLYDLKAMDDAKHRELTGVSNAPILENLRRLAAGPAEVWVRIPLIAGANDDEENIRAAIAFLASLGTIRNVGLLPYHAGGSGKAERIDKSERFRTFAPPSDERYAAIEVEFRRAGFNVQKGG